MYMCLGSGVFNIENIYSSMFPGVLSVDKGSSSVDCSSMVLCFLCFVLFFVFTADIFKKERTVFLCCTIKKKYRN